MGWPHSGSFLGGRTPRAGSRGFLHSAEDHKHAAGNLDSQRQINQLRNVTQATMSRGLRLGMSSMALGPRHRRPLSLYVVPGQCSSGRYDIQ